MTDQHVEVRVDSSAPLFISLKASEFGRIFAAMDSKSQVEVLRAMEEHMRPHQAQWDYVSIELDSPENRRSRDALFQALGRDWPERSRVVREPSPDEFRQRTGEQLHTNQSETGRPWVKSLSFRNSIQFLLDRLAEYTPEEDTDGGEFNGHIAPAAARVRNEMAKQDVVASATPPVQPDDWKARLAKERDDLQDKVDKLIRFVKHGEFFDLPSEDKDLLRNQLGAMQAYVAILSKRLVRSGFKYEGAV